MDQPENKVSSDEQTGQVPATGFTRYPAMRSFLSSLLMAGIFIVVAGGFDLVTAADTPYAFFVVLLIGFAVGLLHENMVKNARLLP